MKLSYAILLFVVAPCFFPPAAAIADAEADAKQALQELFGDRLAATAKTSSIADDIALFDEILPTVASIKDRPEIYEQAALMAVDRLGKKPGGHETAVRIVNGLMKKYPKKWDTYIHKLIEVREHQSRVGLRKQRAAAAAAHVACLLQLATAEFRKDNDEAGLTHIREALVIAKRYRLKVVKGIIAILDKFKEIERQLREIEQLKNRLKADPADTGTAKKLVWIYLLERNNAEEARKYAFLLDDEAFVEMVKLATQPMGDIDEPTSTKLADWYESLSEDPSIEANQKPIALGHAVRYIENYLKLHTAKDLERVKAEIRLRKLKQAAQKLTPERSTAPPRLPALPGR